VAWREKLHAFDISAANCDEYVSFTLWPLYYQINPCLDLVAKRKVSSVPGI
jgi:hypothetical protein